MKVNEVTTSDVTHNVLKGDWPFQVKAGQRPVSWREDPNDQSVYVVVKNTEPRGVPVKTMTKLMTYSVGFSGKVTGDAKKAGVVAVYTPSGKNVKSLMSRYEIKVPNSLIFRFDSTKAPEEAQDQITNMLSKLHGVSGREKAKDDKWRAGAKDRKREDDKYRRAEYNRGLEELYNKYGKNNVKRVRARKYMGDDAYSWAVFIDNHPFVTGLSQSQASHYKRQAYEMLLKKNGKV